MLSHSDKTARDLIAIQIIRTETVLSRLPIHNLSKTGDFEIVINKRRPNGELELRWMVSYNSKYGPPRQLAYKLDTLLVNRRIDAAGKPLPQCLRLGSLREMARELGLGGDTNQIRKALRQNAFTGISAKLSYRSSDGATRSIEADFTRYSVVFAGEKLPDGREADVVHLVLSEPYREVLNNAPFRPLNYDYLKQLTPAAQRFYEIVSYRIYAAVKYGQTCARLPYSEFCMCSALQRYTDYDHFKKQMYKIHRPHLESGYLAKLFYEETRDSEGLPDWIMNYVPGERARQEFRLFHQKHRTRPEVAALAAEREHQLFQELTRRGIAPAQARRLLAGIQPGQPVLEQLQWADELVAGSRSRIQNPPGFYTYLIRENIAPPARAARRAAQDRIEEPAAVFAGDEAAYEEYRRREIDRYLAGRYTPREYEELLERRGREVRRRYRFGEVWSRENLRQVVEGVIRSEAAREIPLMSLAEFREARRQGTPEE